MPVSAEVFDAVRLRAGRACEYCGVHEDDTGGPLTVDHYQPLSRGGTDAEDNLIYACFRCNIFKSDYWPRSTTDTPIWNPRQCSASEHFIELDDGTILSLSKVGEETVKRLRLNRSQLVQHRATKQHVSERESLFRQIAEITDRIAQAESDQFRFLNERTLLLEEQRRLLQALLKWSG